MFGPGPLDPTGWNSEDGLKNKRVPRVARISGAAASGPVAAESSLPFDRLCRAQGIAMF